MSLSFAETETLSNRKKMSTSPLLLDAKLQVSAYQYQEAAKIFYWRYQTCQQ